MTKTDILLICVYVTGLVQGWCWRGIKDDREAKL